MLLIIRVVDMTAKNSARSKVYHLARVQTKVFFHIRCLFFLRVMPSISAFRMTDYHH